eukprot:gene67233-92097_t
MGAQWEAEMDLFVNGYKCEWKEAVENPAIRKRFSHFVNAPEVKDPSVQFAEMREQKKLHISIASSSRLKSGSVHRHANERLLSKRKKDKAACPLAEHIRHLTSNIRHFFGCQPYLREEAPFSARRRDGDEANIMDNTS